MDTRKKRFILGLAGGVLALGAVGVLASQNGFNDGIGAYATEPENMLWKHYAEVKPTYTTHGSKEFWANCSSLGEHSLTQPTKGKIEEGEDFSKTTYFASLTEEDDRYVAKLVPTVSFDSNGGTTVDSQTIEYGEKATEPTAPTREADEYYDAYTFDGWYNNGTKFDFATEIKGSVNLIAKWKYGNKKFDEVTLTSDNTTLEGGAIYRTFDAAFDNMAWINVTTDTPGHVDTTLKASLIEEFGGTGRAADGIFVSPGTVQNGSWITLPAINFKEKLSGGKIMTMELGGYNSWNSVDYGDTVVFSNSSSSGAQQNAACLARVKAYFYLEDEAVKLKFVNRRNTDTSDIFTCDETILDLTEDIANGNTGIKFTFRQEGSNRQYWFGHPRIVKGEYNLLDLTKKENVTVENGILKTREERDKESGAPFTQWKETVALSFDGVGAIGTGSKPLVVNYSKINFNNLFAEGKGVRFALGSWNGQERLTFNEYDFGKSGVKPDLPTNNTADSIIDTWTNFQVEITRVGMNVFNHYEKTEYLLPLSEEILSGEKGLTFNLGTASNNHFFYISNVKAFKA